MTAKSRMTMPIAMRIVTNERLPDERFP